MRPLAATTVSVAARAAQQAATAAQIAANVARLHYEVAQDSAVLASLHPPPIAWDPSTSHPTAAVAAPVISWSMRQTRCPHGPGCLHGDGCPQARPPTLDELHEDLNDLHRMM